MVIRQTEEVFIKMPEIENTATKTKNIIDSLVSRLHPDKKTIREPENIIYRNYPNRYTRRKIKVGEGRKTD